MTLTDIQAEILTDAIRTARSLDIRSVKILRNILIKTYCAADVDVALMYWATKEVESEQRNTQ